MNSNRDAGTRTSQNLDFGLPATFVSNLEGAIDGQHLVPGEIHGTHEGRPILVRYDLDAVSRVLTRENLGSRARDLWRLKELLPVREGDEISLGEVVTPLIPCSRTAARYGLRNVWIKDESVLPTGSFKSRGQAVAISMAKALGIASVAIPNLFGRTHLGAIASAQMSCMVAGSAVGPALLALAKNFIGSYRQGLLLCCGLSLAAAVLAFGAQMSRGSERSGR